MNSDMYPHTLCNGYGVHCDGCANCKASDRATEAGTPAKATEGAGAIERFSIYHDHDRADMMTDDEGEYVLYSHYLAALDARAEDARREAEAKQAARIAHLTHERDLARRAVHVALEHHTDAAAQPVAEAAAQAEDVPVFGIGDRVVTTDSFKREGVIRRIYRDETKAYNVVGDFGGGMYGAWELKHAAPTAQPTPKPMSSYAAAKCAVEEVSQEIGAAQPTPPDEMTPEMMRAVQIKSELGAYACANLSGAYDLFREFWSVALAAKRAGKEA